MRAARERAHHGQTHDFRRAHAAQKPAQRHGRERVEVRNDVAGPQALGLVADPRLEHDVVLVVRGVEKWRGPPARGARGVGHVPHGSLLEGELGQPGGVEAEILGRRHEILFFREGDFLEVVQILYRIRYQVCLGETALVERVRTPAQGDHSPQALSPQLMQRVLSVHRVLRPLLSKKFRPFAAASAHIVQSTRLPRASRRARAACRRTSSGGSSPRARRP